MRCFTQSERVLLYRVAALAPKLDTIGEVLS
jgi:hypothetical protein